MVNQYQPSLEMLHADCLRTLRKIITNIDPQCASKESNEQLSILRDTFVVVDDMINKKNPPPDLGFNPAFDEQESEA